MKKFKVTENFRTAIVTEIEVSDNVCFDDDKEEQLINAHLVQVANWSEKDYAREVANNADDSEFEIEEITG